MADNIFTLDKTSGSGKDTIKISCNKDIAKDHNKEYYDLKLKNREDIITTVKLQRVYIKKDDLASLVKPGAGVDIYIPGFIDFKDLVTKLDTETGRSYYKYKRILASETMRILQPLNIDDPNYLKKICNQVYLFHYKNNKWVKLTEIAKNLTDIIKDNCLLINTCYFGGILIDYKGFGFEPAYDKKIEEPACYLILDSIYHIIWPIVYTKEQNTSDKPYYVKINFKDTSKIPGFTKDKTECKFDFSKAKNYFDELLSIPSDNLEVGKNYIAFKKKGDEKITYIRKGYTSFNPKVHISISLAEPLEYGKIPFSYRVYSDEYFNFTLMNNKDSKYELLSGVARETNISMAGIPKEKKGIPVINDIPKEIYITGKSVENIPLYPSPDE